MAVYTGGQALLKFLENAGIDTIFGIPGTHSLSIYDALLDTPSIRHILVRHEQAAAFMADGYARSTGKIGVCLTTTGPAAFNTIAALATSYGDSCPVLLLCTQIPSEYIGKNKGIFHEVPDQLGVLNKVSCFSARSSDIQSIVDLVNKAIYAARSRRPRPVVVELPTDVLNNKSEVTFPPNIEIVPYAANMESLHKSLILLHKAKRPLIWAGGGVIISDASKEVADLSEILQAPVLTTNSGKGCIPSDHPLHLGYITTQKPVQDYLASCDLLIAIGTRFSYLSTDRWTLPLPKTIIHIDIDEEMIGKNFPVTVGMVGDAKLTLQKLIDILKGNLLYHPDRTQEVLQIKNKVSALWKEQVPAEYKLIQDLRSALPRETIFVGDPTMCAYSAWNMLEIYQPRSYLYPMSCATLGYGFPAALGAKIANPDRPVLSICGDAGFLFSCQELGTAVQYGINTITLVFNDNGYGVLRSQQDDRFHRRNQVDLVNPDFVALARAFGAQGMRVNHLDELKSVIRSSLNYRLPTIIEIPVELSTQKITS